MSYSFNWDCTLPITNIQDIVSINIVPETQAYNEGDYLSIRGHISIDGEYVSSKGEQKVFNESIPLDITLPNTGRHGDIKVDVTNFDYDIEDDEKLCLDLNLSIGGYDLDSVPILVEEEEEAPKEQAPVLFTKEAIVSHPTPKTSQVVELEEDEDDADDHHSAFIDTDDVDYLDFDEVVMPSQQQEAIELIDEDDDEDDRQEILECIQEGDHHEEVAELGDEDDRKEKLTDKIKQLINKEQVVVESQPVIEEPVIEVQPSVEEVVTPEPVVEEVIVQPEPVVEKPKPVVKPKPVMPIPVVTTVVEPEPEPEETVIEEDEEEVIVQPEPVEEVIVQPEPVVKPKPVMPIPVVTSVVEPESEETVIEEDEEEVLPFPLKTTSPVIVEPQPSVVDKSNIFDMLYELDQEEPEEIVIEQAPVVTPTPVVQQVVEPVYTPTPAVQSVVEPAVAPTPAVQSIVTSTPTPQPTVEEVSVTPTTYDDSIASQFADGESIIKIVFVQEEEVTLTDLCTKYSVQEENVYNCNNLNFPLCQGDRVMINYGTYRGR